MVVAIIVLMYVASLVTVADALPWPQSSWASADRQRSWWLGNLTFGLLLVPWSFVIAVAYCVGVRPRLSSSPVVSGRFAK